MIQEKSCGAVIFLRNPILNYLLLHYEAGHWGFVKGNVEFNESEKETVIREREEETGILDAKFIEAFREKVTYIYVRKGQGRGNIEVAGFGAKFTEQTLKNAVNQETEASLAKDFPLELFRQLTWRLDKALGIK